MSRLQSCPAWIGLPAVSPGMLAILLLSWLDVSLRLSPVIGLLDGWIKNEEQGPCCCRSDQNPSQNFIGSWIHALMLGATGCKA